MKKFIAFTLAETLIVMGIIGVVAALTLPNLNSSTGEKEKVAKLMKIYSNLNDAVGRAEAVYGPYDTWSINDGSSNYAAITKRSAERVTEFMKISKNCEQDTSKLCFGGVGAKNRKGNITEYDNLDAPTTISTATYKFITADQTAISFGHDGNAGNGMTIFVCLKGGSGCTGKLGSDVFLFGLSNGNITPYGNSDTDTQIQSGCLKKTSLGLDCAGWVIQTGNLDYLKADDSGKCPNGTVLSWTNTTCK